MARKNSNPEGIVSKAVRGLIAPFAMPIMVERKKRKTKEKEHVPGEAVYSIETGALGTWHHDPGNSARASGMVFKGRPGGTRTTSGFPDGCALLVEPVSYTLFMEYKSPSGSPSYDQWQFAEAAMRIGQPHLIVRSVEEFLTGLRYLGLWPERWLRNPPRPLDFSVWPQNMNFLPPMREGFWEKRADRPMGDTGGLVVPPNRRRAPPLAP